MKRMFFLLLCCALMLSLPVGSSEDRRVTVYPMAPLLALPVEPYHPQPLPLELRARDAPISMPTLSTEEIELIALLTMAEAEGECEEGKRLVIDTVLNRVDSPHFPDTVTDVIYQPNQYTPIWNGRMERCEVREDICELVHEELASRTNQDVIFFTSLGYSAYGVPLFQIGNHYFSSYEEVAQ